MKLTNIAFLLSAMLAVSGCEHPSVIPAPNELIKGCADSDLSSKSVLYFGPSNQIAPGSVWSRLGDMGGYQPQWRLQDLGIDSNVVDKGVNFTCDLSSNRRFATNASLSVLSSVANVSADASSDFSRGKVTSVKTTGAAWDTVIEGPYKKGLTQLADSQIRDDVMGKNRIVMRRALRLDGYQVTMDFDAALKPSIKAKYSGKILGKDTVGDVGANLSAQWTQDDKLQLTASDSIYVAGEFAELVNGQWVSTKGGAGIADLRDKWTKPIALRQ